MTKRVFKGDDYRQSRFRDYTGQPLDCAGWLYLPAAVATTIGYKLFGYRPCLPWLGFRAMDAIQQILTPTSTVLEFGAGMSSVWLAQRCGHLTSIETNPEWHRRCLELLARKSLTNIRLCLAATDTDYPRLNDLPDQSFDFILVDGINRLTEMQIALKKIKRDGHIYLDNSDVPHFEHQSAKDILMKAAVDVRLFVDFCPCYVGVNQGMLVQVR
jgi:Methyltransferase domain